MTALAPETLAAGIAALDDVRPRASRTPMQIALAVWVATTPEGTDPTPNTLKAGARAWIENVSVIEDGVSIPREPGEVVQAMHLAMTGSCGGTG